MHAPQRTQARILDTHNVLVAPSKLDDESPLKDFCGAVIALDDPAARLPDLADKTVYLCGDLSRVRAQDLEAAARIFVVRPLSHGHHDDSDTWPRVDLGQVPIHVHGLGVYYRRFFDPDCNYVERIRTEHTFQSLTESTKPGTAHRTGIYLTPVEPDGEALHFRLLRCSTNLSGPTENFRATDRHIVDALNQEAAFIFQDQAPLNHVLAQLYHNTPATAEHKQSKAKISAHADKTKDMPDHGIMAFCTFYDRLDKLAPLARDPFDVGHKTTSGLTRLRFRLKESVAQRPGCTLPPQFTLTLYPHSAFFMPLSTNRLYTHEIQSPTLDAAMLPIRLGYVVRCSSAEAVHQHGQTFLELDGKQVPLEPPTPEGMAELRQSYAEENRTDAFIDYGDKFRFSMNKGDYLAPAYDPRDEFRVYTLPASAPGFAALLASARLEDLGKGRRGAVLFIKTANKTDSVPIVRTTTPYTTPAQIFRPVHAQLAAQIQQSASLAIPVNNALIEHYTDAYTTMGSHSDQALDLADESSIALFSAYEHPERATPPRKLIVESKTPGGDKFEVPLTHNSVVVFSVAANRRFKHKIVRDTSTRAPENHWLGVTFRTSRTTVRVRDGQAYLADDTPLTLATEDQRREFFRLRSRENNEADFTYPPLTYTISESDRMPPAPPEPIAAKDK